MDVTLRGFGVVKDKINRLWIENDITHLRPIVYDGIKVEKIAKINP